MNEYDRISRLWVGETAFILACGPSLRGFDASVLRGRRVITINDSYQLATWADVLYACDARWWETRASVVAKAWQGGMRVTLENRIPGVLRLRNTGESWLETEPDGLRNGKNSGYQAIGLAYHLGAARIVLLGYDMQLGARSEMHWNARPERQTEAGFARTLSLMLPLFDTLAEPLAAAGVEVLNATPGSALRTWPMVRLGDVLD